MQSANGELARPLGVKRPLMPRMVGTNIGGARTGRVGWALAGHVVWLAYESHWDVPNADTHRSLVTRTTVVSVMPRSHQTFYPVTTVKLLGIMFRSRRWPTTFHTITAGDADGWC
jgi:hypothetical protein